MHGSLTFLTPLASVIGILAVVPQLALAVALRRVRRARMVLRLPGDGPEIAWLRVLALASVPLLLALAIAQPVLRRHGSQPARADAAVFAVIDTSASMGASSGPKAPTRLDRAKRIAVDVAAGLGGVPVGVASFTDRVLPNLFPTIDRAVVDSTLWSLGTDSPPPRETSRVATSFAALGALERSSFFTDAETQRALLLITDGESRPFDAATLARTLAGSPRVHVVVVRVGGGDDRLYGSDGHPGSSYRSDPEGARQAVAQLVLATGGRSSAGGSAGVAPALRSVLGSGPTTRITSEPETRALAPYVVLLSLIPLLVLLAGSGGTFCASRRLH